jgi:transaldolase
MDGSNLIKEIVNIFNIHNIKTEIIAASVRHLIHVTEVAQLGAHIATVPYNVIVNMAKHPLTDAGIEKFLNDWKNVPNA